MSSTSTLTSSRIKPFTLALERPLIIQLCTYEVPRVVDSILNTIYPEMPAKFFNQLYTIDGYPDITDLQISDVKLDCVDSLKYLGAIIADEGSKPNVIARSSQTTAALAKNIVLSSKIRLMRSLVISIFLYACESWTLTAELERRIQAMDMRCFRKLLGITYRDRISNEEVRSRVKQAIGPHDDLLTTIRRSGTGT